jgi:hypothetical protein
VYACLTMVIVDWKVAAAASVELVGLFYLYSRSLLSTHATASHRSRYAEDVRAPGGQPRSAARVLIQWQNLPAACRLPVLRLVSISGDKGRGVRALPAAQTWHTRRRRTQSSNIYNTHLHVRGVRALPAAQTPGGLAQLDVVLLKRLAHLLACNSLDL